MAEIERSAEVLSAWLKANSGNVASQFGITAQQLAGVIGNYEGDDVATARWRDCLNLAGKYTPLPQLRLF